MKRTTVAPILMTIQCYASSRGTILLVWGYCFSIHDKDMRRPALRLKQ